jgi:hypothetical protein
MACNNTCQVGPPKYETTVKQHTLGEYLDVLTSMKCEDLFNLYKQEMDKIDTVAVLNKSHIKIEYIKETYIYLIAKYNKISETVIKSFTMPKILEYCREYDTVKGAEGAVFATIEDYYKFLF